MRSASHPQAQPIPLAAAGLRVAIVVSRFNATITERLLNGARDELATLGVRSDAVTVIHVPGAFEIPVVAKHLAASSRFDGILCVGCIVRGVTPHFEQIARECAHGIQQVALATGIPVIFGVLTAETMEQAEERAGGRFGNQGAHGARTLVEMAHLVRSLK